MKCASRWRSEVESHSYTVAYGAEDSSVRSDTVASHLSQVGPGYCAVEGRTRGYCGVKGHIDSWTINHTYPLYPLSLSLSRLTLHSPLFILPPLPLTTPLTHSRTTTRVCASPPCPPYVHCVGSYNGPEVMRRCIGWLLRGKSTMGIVLVEHSLDIRCGQV